MNFEFKTDKQMKLDEYSSYFTNEDTFLKTTYNEILNNKKNDCYKNYKWEYQIYKEIGYLIDNKTIYYFKKWSFNVRNTMINHRNGNYLLHPYELKEDKNIKANLIEGVPPKIINLKKNVSLELYLSLITLSNKVIFILLFEESKEYIHTFKLTNNDKIIAISEYFFLSNNSFFIAFLTLKSCLIILKVKINNNKEFVVTECYDNIKFNISKGNSKVKNNLPIYYSIDIKYLKNKNLISCLIYYNDIIEKKIWDFKTNDKLMVESNYIVKNIKKSLINNEKDELKKFKNSSYIQKIEILKIINLKNYLSFNIVYWLEIKISSLKSVYYIKIIKCEIKNEKIIFGNKIDLVKFKDIFYISLTKIIKYEQNFLLILKGNPYYANKGKYKSLLILWDYNLKIISSNEVDGIIKGIGYNSKSLDEKFILFCENKVIYVELNNLLAIDNEKKTKIKDLYMFINNYFLKFWCKGLEDNEYNNIKNMINDCPLGIINDIYNKFLLTYLENDIADIENILPESNINKFEKNYTICIHLFNFFKKIDFHNTRNLFKLVNYIIIFKLQILIKKFFIENNSIKDQFNDDVVKNLQILSTFLDTKDYNLILLFNNIIKEIKIIKEKNIFDSINLDNNINLKEEFKSLYIYKNDIFQNILIKYCEILLPKLIDYKDELINIFIELNFVNNLKFNDYLNNNLCKMFDYFIKYDINIDRLFVETKNISYIKYYFSKKNTTKDEIEIVIKSMVNFLNNQENFNNILNYLIDLYQSEIYNLYFKNRLIKVFEQKFLNKEVENYIYDKDIRLLFEIYLNLKREQEAINLMKNYFDANIDKFNLFNYLLLQKFQNLINFNTEIQIDPLYKKMVNSKLSYLQSKHRFCIKYNKLEDFSIKTYRSILENTNLHENLKNKKLIEVIRLENNLSMDILQELT